MANYLEKEGTHLDGLIVDHGVSGMTASQTVGPVHLLSKVCTPPRNRERKSRIAAYAGEGDCTAPEPIFVILKRREVKPGYSETRVAVLPVSVQQRKNAHKNARDERHFQGGWEKIEDQRNENELYSPCSSVDGLANSSCASIQMVGQIQSQHMIENFNTDFANGGLCCSSKDGVSQFIQT